MARRRSRRRKSSYEPTTSGDSSPAVAADELSPRARRLVESGVIDLTTINGTGDGGRITSGDILHAARVMEMEQSVARIETAHEPVAEPNAEEEHAATPDIPEEAVGAVHEESDTSTAVAIGGEPVSVPATPWEDYNGTTEGLSESARPGADQSWGEAEAHLAAMADGAPSDAMPDVPESEAHPPSAAVQQDEDGFEVTTPVAETPEIEDSEAEAVADEVQPVQGSDAVELDSAEEQTQIEPEPHREVMMDFGTLELVDPESVWAEGAEDFAPWFLAHSQQLGDVLGLEAGLTDARQFTTKSATGVLGRDDSGEDVVVVSSKSATADDSDLGHALGMAASSGAASVALVSASIDEDQLKALAWLNNQTKSGVRWYGIEMRVVRIADSPAAMLFDLVAAPKDSNI